jgi:hypothetical protein
MAIGKYHLIFQNHRNIIYIPYRCEALLIVNTLVIYEQLTN